MSRRFLAKILLAVIALAAVAIVVGLLPTSSVAAWLPGSDSPGMPSARSVRAPTP